MRYIFLFSLIAVGAVSALFASNAPTSIVVVSTVHSATKAFNADSLVSLLDRIQPDVILIEFDSSFFDSEGLLQKKFEQLTIETSAVMSYVAHHGVHLHPYDIEGRNAYFAKTDYFSKEMALHRAMDDLYRLGKIEGEAKATYEALVSYGGLRDSFGSSTLAILNSNACDAGMERKEHYSFEGISRIIELTPALDQYKDFWKEAANFWERRNSAMVRHILNYANNYPGKKIVVLCGFEHGYYLRSALRSAAKSSPFVIVDP